MTVSVAEEVEAAAVAFAEEVEAVVLIRAEEEEAVVVVHFAQRQSALVQPGEPCQEVVRVCISGCPSLEIKK